MPGIFGDLFDFDGDGALNCVEQAAELVMLEQIMTDDDDSRGGGGEDESEG